MTLGYFVIFVKVNSKKILLDHALKGILFENLMIAEYVKQMHHQDELQDIWFWRE